MSIKYFTTLHIPIPFGELATDNYKTEKAMIEAEEFEKKLIKDVLDYTVYRKTVFEEAERLNGGPLDEYQTCDLLGKYTNVDYHVYLPLEDLTLRFFETK